MSTTQREHYHILIEWLLDGELETPDFIRRSGELCVPPELIAIALSYKNEFMELEA